MKNTCVHDPGSGGACYECYEKATTRADKAEADNDRLKATADTLREALERIVLVKMDDDDKRFVGELKDIARAALAERKP